MSMFDLKGGDGNGWNYSDDTKENYSESLVGTVIEISNPQALDFNSKKPLFWDDGNPKRNLCMTVLTQDGKEIKWTFAPKSKATDAILAALDPQGTLAKVSIELMLGKFVCIQTQAGAYNNKHPRPWWVTIQGEGDHSAVRGLKDLSQEQPAQPQPQPQAQPAPMPMTAQGYQAQANGAAMAMNAMQSSQPPVPQQAYAQPVQPQQYQQPQYDTVPVEVYGEDVPF